MNTASVTLSTTEITIDANTGLIKVYTANSATIGSHVATVTVTLTNYPTKTVTLDAFTITVQPCVITGFTMSNLSPVNDQTYTVADVSRSWSLLATSITTQIPACGYA